MRFKLAIIVAFLTSMTFCYKTGLAKSPPGNYHPVAVLKVRPSRVAIGQSVRLDASASYDPDGSIAKCEWDFDNGGGAFIPDYNETPGDKKVEHTYDSNGIHIAALRVTDDKNNSSSNISYYTIMVTDEEVFGLEEPYTTSFEEGQDGYWFNNWQVSSWNYVNSRTNYFQSHSYNSVYIDNRYCSTDCNVSIKRSFSVDGFKNRMTHIRFSCIPTQGSMINVLDGNDKIASVYFNPDNYIYVWNNGNYLNTNVNYANDVNLARHFFKDAPSDNPNYTYENTWIKFDVVMDWNDSTYNVYWSYWNGAEYKVNDTIRENAVFDGPYTGFTHIEFRKQGTSEDSFEINRLSVSNDPTGGGVIGAYEDIWIYLPESDPLEPLKGRCEIVGSVWYEDIGRYVIKYCPADFNTANEANWVEISQGKNVVEYDSLGYWDTSALKNGDYFLRIEVYNDLGLLHDKKIISKTMTYNHDEFQKEVNIPYSVYTKLQGGTFNYEEKPDIVIDWPGQFPFELKRTYNSGRSKYPVPFFFGWTYSHDIKLCEDCTFKWTNNSNGIPIADANGLGIGKIWLMNGGSSSLYLGQVDPNDERRVVYKSVLENDYIVRTSSLYAGVPHPQFSVSYTYYGRDGIEIVFDRLDVGNPVRYDLNYVPFAGEGAVDWSVTVGATEKRDRFGNALNYNWHYQDDSPLYITEITNNRTDAYIKFEVYDNYPLYSKAFLKIGDGSSDDANVMTVSYNFDFSDFDGYHVIRDANKVLVQVRDPENPDPNEYLYKEHNHYSCTPYLLTGNPGGCLCEEGTFVVHYCNNENRVEWKNIESAQQGKIRRNDEPWLKQTFLYDYDDADNLVTEKDFLDGSPMHGEGAVYKKVTTVQNSDGALLSEKTKTIRSDGYIDFYNYYNNGRMGSGGIVDVNQFYDDPRFPTRPTMIIEYFDDDGAVDCYDNRAYDRDSRKTTMTYDQFGNLIERRVYIDDINFMAIQWEFHLLYDFPVRQTTWQGYCYDDGGEIVPSGKKIETLYIYGDANGTSNSQGKFLVQKKDLLNDNDTPTEIDDSWAITCYTYYDTGLVKSQIDPAGNITFFEYDENGFTSRVWKGAMLDSGYPVGNPQERFYYDEVGQCLLQADALGAVTMNVYDGLGRIEITRKYHDVNAVSRADFNPDVYDDPDIVEDNNDFDSKREFWYYNPFSEYDWPGTRYGAEEDGTPLLEILNGAPYVKEILDTGGKVRRRHDYGYHAAYPAVFVYDDNSVMHQNVMPDNTPIRKEYIPCYSDDMYFNSTIYERYEGFIGGFSQDFYSDSMNRPVHQIWQEYDYLDDDLTPLAIKHQETGYYGDGSKQFEKTYSVAYWKNIYNWWRTTETLEKYSEYKYDHLGRLITQIDHDACSPPGDANSLIDPNNRITTFGYDAAGNRIYIIDPNGNCLFTDYDNANRKIKEYFATEAIMDGNSLNYQATKANAKLRQQVGYFDDGKVASVKTYDNDGTTRLSRKLFSYDTRGRIAQVAELCFSLMMAGVDANAVTNYYYADTTSASLLGPTGDENYHIQIVDAEGKSTYIQLNEYGMTKKILYPSGDYELTEYTNEYGFKYILPYKKTVWNNNGDPCTIQYEYDSYGKVKKILYPDGWLEYEYGPRCFGKFGRVEKIKDYRNSADRLGSPGNAYKYTYDCLDRITAYNDSNQFIVQSDYRAADNQKYSIKVIKTGEPCETIYDVNYAYNLFGQMERVYDPCILDVNIASMQYDDNGNRKQLKYWLAGEINDVNYTIDYSYNINNNLTEITAGRPAGEPNYTFDACGVDGIDGLGRLKYAVETISWPAQANRSHISGFSYNMQSGLTHADISNVNGSTWTAGYTYKKDGNIEEKSTNGSPESYEYDTTSGGSVFDSDIMTKAGDDDLTWDENGRLVAKPTTDFEYNWDGKLRQVICEQGLVELKYDPMGNRVYKRLNAQSARRFIVDISGGLPVILCEIDPSTSSITNKYYYANAQILRQDNSAGSFYYVHDRLGSVRLVISSVGSESSVANSYTYNPFGEDLAAECSETVENPFKFTGQWYDDEISQYYLRARQYDPALMRFGARDPANEVYEEPLTLHRYLYCLNDPVDYLDETGEFYDMPYAASEGAEMYAQDLAIGGMAIACMSAILAHNEIYQMSLESICTGISNGMNDMIDFGLVVYASTRTKAAEKDVAGAMKQVALHLDKINNANPGDPMKKWLKDIRKHLRNIRKAADRLNGKKQEEALNNVDEVWQKLEGMAKEHNLPWNY